MVALNAPFIGPRACQVRWLQRMAVSIWAAMAWGAITPDAASQESQSAADQAFPGVPNTKQIGSLKDKADRFFEEGKFRKAHLIYWGDLAPKGDKYSQYMVGYHLLHGLGVQRNPVRALAWYQLAAERGNQHLATARDDLKAQLGDEEIASAEAAFQGLQEEYGDRALVQRLIRDDLQRLRSIAGTRIPGGIGGPGRVVMADGRSMDISRYSKALRDRIEWRKEYLRGRVEYGEFKTIKDEFDEPTSREANEAE